MIVGVVGSRVGKERGSGDNGPFYVWVLKVPEQALGGRVGCPVLALEEDGVVVVMVDNETAPHARNAAVRAVNFQLKGALSLHRRGHWDLGVGEEIGEDL